MVPIALVIDYIWFSTKLSTGYLIRLVIVEIGFFIRVRFICADVGLQEDSSKINLCLDQMDHPYRNIRKYLEF